MKKGFTLIETTIYIALFGLIITGSLMTAFQLIYTTDNLNNKKVTQEEINFVLRKIDWALVGASSVTTPSPSSPYSNNLSATKYDGNQVDIRLNTGKIEMRESVIGVYLPLTTDSAIVSSLSFHYITPVGNAPAGIEASTTINSIIASTTKYMRK